MGHLLTKGNRIKNALGKFASTIFLMDVGGLDASYKVTTVRFGTSNAPNTGPTGLQGDFIYSKSIDGVTYGALSATVAFTLLPAELVGVTIAEVALYTANNILFARAIFDPVLVKGGAEEVFAWEFDFNIPNSLVPTTSAPTTMAPTTSAPTTSAGAIFTDGFEQDFLYWSPTQTDSGRYAIDTVDPMAGHRSARFYCTTGWQSLAYARTTFTPAIVEGDEKQLSFQFRQNRTATHVGADIYIPTNAVRVAALYNSGTKKGIMLYLSSTAGNVNGKQFQIFSNVSGAIVNTLDGIRNLTTTQIDIKFKASAASTGYAKLYVDGSLVAQFTASTYNAPFDTLEVGPSWKGDTHTESCFWYDAVIVGAQS